MPNNKKLKAGDRVRLLQILKVSSESENWILRERNKGKLVFVGMELEVLRTSKDGDGNTWLSLEGMEYEHPAEKFELATNERETIKTLTTKLRAVYADLVDERNANNTLRAANTGLKVGNAQVWAEVKTLRAKIKELEN